MHEKYRKIECIDPGVSMYDPPLEDQIGCEKPMQLELRPSKFLIRSDTYD